MNSIRKAWQQIHSAVNMHDVPIQIVITKGTIRGSRTQAVTFIISEGSIFAH